MTTYVIHPDKTIVEFDEWPENKKDLPVRSYVYEPHSPMLWVLVITDYGSLKEIKAHDVPAYCKALQLLVPPTR